MGTYVNIGNDAFASIRNGEYTDKSGLIDVINSTLFTEHRFTCVTRSRRFGKSMAARMLSSILSTIPKPSGVMPKLDRNHTARVERTIMVPARLIKDQPRSHILRKTFAAEGRW